MIELDGDEPVHVMPNYGKEHFCSPDCWCSPDIENEREVLAGEHCAYIYVHKVLH